MIEWETLHALVGAPVTDPELLALLRTCRLKAPMEAGPSHLHSVTSRAYGLEIDFGDAESMFYDEGATEKRSRLEWPSSRKHRPAACNVVAFVLEINGTKKPFRGTLPLGLKIGARSAALRRALGKPSKREHENGLLWFTRDRDLFLRVEKPCDCGGVDPTSVVLRLPCAGPQRL